MSLTIGSTAPDFVAATHHKVATPANWQVGGDVVIAGSVTNEQARETFGTWTEPKPYLRIVPQPV